MGGYSLSIYTESSDIETYRDVLYYVGQVLGGFFCINREGKSRLYVHLSDDTETARKVGMRHGRPVIYLVKSGDMHRDGIMFYRSVNGVWLTKEVPPKYLDRI